MLYILSYKNVEEDEASRLFGKPVLEDPDSIFNFSVERKGDCVSANPYFQKILKDVDNSDVPMPNVIRHLPTGLTHDIFKVSTGVKTLWLAATGANYMFLSQWFGENCYQELFDISKNIDIYMYEDSYMFRYDYIENLKGTFTDFKSGTIVNVDGHATRDYLYDIGFY